MKMRKHKHKVWQCVMGHYRTRMAAQKSKKQFAAWLKQALSTPQVDWWRWAMGKDLGK